MKYAFRTVFAIHLLTCVAGFSACRSQQPRKDTATVTSFPYQQFRDSVLRADSNLTEEPTNIFDKPAYNPAKDSLRPLLIQIDTLWRRQAHLMEQLDTLKSRMGQEAGFTPDELAAIRENIREVERFLTERDSVPKTACREKECLVYAVIDKSKQRLYLYVMGELKDTFKVSTGKGKKYETPSMSRHPAGPVLIKYMSKKFPGGNYKGLGNMPYAVFVSGGYAIHGTTPGNYSKLGTKASHGCIRLHPDNAKIFNALVKSVGLSQTWVVIRDSL